MQTPRSPGPVGCDSIALVDRTDQGRGWAALSATLREAAVAMDSSPGQPSPTLATGAAADGYVQGLLAALTSDASVQPAGLLVGPATARADLQRTARFVNAAARRPALDVLVLDASPLRLAVLVDLVLSQVVPEGALGVDDVSAWLVALEHHSRAIAVLPRVRHLASMRPAWRDRWALPSGSRRFLATDDGRLVRAGVAELAPVAQVVTTGLPDWPGRRAVISGGDATTGIDLVAALGLDTPDLVPRREHWARWWTSGPVTEVVLAPQDVLCLGAEVAELGATSWRCRWCLKRQFSDHACSRCHADNSIPVEASAGAGLPSPA
jgi:hypothetical protein